jgi:peroxiredoxin Q/BCP
MAQLRRDYPEFVARDAQVVVVGPEDQTAFRRYWQEHELPFVGLADPTHAVARRYGQEVKLLKLGRMPALMIVDKAGRVRFQHHGGAMHDIPPNKLVLATLDRIIREDGSSAEAEETGARLANQGT